VPVVFSLFPLSISSWLYLIPGADRDGTQRSASTFLMPAALLLALTDHFHSTHPSSFTWAVGLTRPWDRFPSIWESNNSFTDCVRIGPIFSLRSVSLDGGRLFLRARACRKGASFPARRVLVPCETISVPLNDPRFTRPICSLEGDECGVGSNSPIVPFAFSPPQADLIQLQPIGSPSR
jgi:hypothetical protein